jgi:hypothetical protein
MRKSPAAIWPILMVLDLVFTLGTAVVWTTTMTAMVGLLLANDPPWAITLSDWKDSFNSFFTSKNHPMGRALIPSAMCTSVWLWLYAGSGFVLKTARRFDIGFDWFNRHFDIEKKPLQSIGLVAGAIVACVYWAVVVVMRFL